MFGKGEGRIKAKATNGYLETVDIMELLGVSNQTVYKLIKDGKLKTDSGCYPGSRQRYKVEVDAFKAFLLSSPKYYARVCEEELEVQNEDEVVEESKPEEVKIDTPTAIACTVSELIGKYEDICTEIQIHEEEINKLKEKKEALEKVIDMF